MKTSIVIFASLVSVALCCGQNTFPSSGNVNIGDSAVLGEAHWSSEGMNYPALSTFGGTIVRGNSLNVGQFTIGSWTQSAPENGLFVGGNTILNGHVGVGTVSPAATLDVAGVINGRNYQVPGTSGTSQWVKLGTFTGGQVGHTIRIVAYIHQGFNASNNQDGVYTIIFKTSNSASADANGFYGNGSWYEIGNNASIPPGSIKWKASSGNTVFDLFINLPVFTENSHYTISLPDSASWTHVGTLGHADPGAASSTVLVPSVDFNLPYGNVGIGTTNPASKLHVRYDGDVPVTVESLGSNSYLSLKNNAGGSSISSSGNTLYIGESGAIFLRSGGWDVKMAVFPSGDVGIGTTNPTEKLSVNGKIRAKEVIVETTGWSDYVFEEGYKLQSLADIEAQIKTSKHLPGVPSAQEVSEKGVSLGDMQSILLAKIEELTLHQIAQEKNQIEQAQELITQRAKLEAQAAKIAALELENAQLKH